MNIELYLWHINQINLLAMGIIKNLKANRDLDQYVEVLDDLFMIYIESEQSGQDGPEGRVKVAFCVKELKEELIKAQS